jgi:hypothetical protein
MSHAILCASHQYASYTTYTFLTIHIFAEYCESTDLPYVGKEVEDGREYDVYRQVNDLGTDIRKETLYAKAAADGACIPVERIIDYNGTCACHIAILLSANMYV